MQSNKALRKNPKKKQVYTVLESYDFGQAKIEFLDNGITFIQFANDIEVELELSLRLFAFLKEKLNNKSPRLIMIEMGKYSTLTKESREFAYAEEALGFDRTTAVIVHSLAQRLVINLMVDFKLKHSVKVKAFKNKTEAISWLLKQPCLNEVKSA